MRIIHFLSSGNFSGAEKIAVGIIENSKRIHDVYYASPNGEIENILIEKKIKHIPMESFTIYQTKQVIEKYKPDIIHSHDFRASMYSAIVKKDTKIVAHIHNNTKWLRTINKNSISYLIASFRIDKIVNVSSSINNEYIFKSTIKNKSRTIFNVVDKFEIEEKSEEISSREKYDLIFLGRLSKEKAPDRFIEIVEEISNHLPDIKACIVGKGDMDKQCKRMIAEKKLENNINMIGYKKNPYPTLNHSKLLVITSEWEGFGLSAVESLVLGKPVVASNVGGLPEIITNEVGALCNINEEFVENILQLIENNEIYNEKSKEAIKKSLEFTNKERFYKEFLQIYESFI